MLFKKFCTNENNFMSVHKSQRRNFKKVTTAQQFSFDTKDFSKTVVTVHFGVNIHRGMNI